MSVILRYLTVTDAKNDRLALYKVVVFTFLRNAGFSIFVFLYFYLFLLFVDHLDSLNSAKTNVNEYNKNKWHFLILFSL